MSATVLEELVIRLGFQPSPNARNALRDFELGLQGLVTAATAAVAALGALTIQQAYAGDEAAKTARALGVTVEEYSRIAAAAAGSGVQIEDLRTGMASLTRQLDAAGQAGSPLAATFAQLGIEVRDSSGNLRSAADVLPELADALNRTDLGGRNGAIGLQLLGDGATKMATMLRGGSKGMREAAERAEALGLVIGQDFADDSEDLVASLREVSAVVSGVARVITGPLIGALDRVIERVLDWYGRNRDVISTQIDRFAVVLAAALDGLATPLGQVVGLFAALGAAFVQYKIAGSMLAAAKAVPALGAALESLSASFAVLAAWAWPITAVVAALTALYLIGDDLVSAFSGGESAIAGFFEYLQPGGAEAFRAVLHGVVDVLGALGDLAVAVGERIGLYLSGALEELGIVFDALWTIGGLFVDLLGSAASIVYDVGTAIASTLLGALRELVPGLDLALSAISAVYGFLADLFAPQIEYVGQVLDDYLIAPLNTAAEVLGELLSLDLGALASRLASLAGWFGGAAESVSAGTATESTAQANKIGAARVGLGAVKAGAVVASQAAAAGARTVSSTVNGGPVSVTMNVTGATPEEVEAIARRTVAGAVSDGYATVGGGVR